MAPLFMSGFENAAPEYQRNYIANFLLLFSIRPVRFSNISAIPSRRNRRFPTASPFRKPAKTNYNNRYFPSYSYKGKDISFHKRKARAKAC